VVRAAYTYDRTVAGLVHRAKYRDSRSLLGLLAGAAALRLPRPEAAAVVPVPLGPRRRRERGYNQAELLARRLAAVWGLPVRLELARVRETEAQVGRDAASRRANAAGAFAWTGESLDGVALVLVDDVVTTGATITAAAAPLVGAGARVTVAALARRL
jgi:ComF family protein